MNGEQVLSEAVDAYRARLGGRLLAAYALGSLAHGGFSELVSDIDLGLIVSDPIEQGDAAMIEAVAGAEKAKVGLHARLSVFWGTPSTLRGERDGGRFPALDRLDLLESGRLLAGNDDVRRGLPHPSSHELVVTGAQFALNYLAGVRRATGSPSDALGSMPLADEDAIQEILCPKLLVGRGMRRVTKLVLFPVRFLYTASTGQVGTNDAAAARYIDDARAPSRELVAAARAWRGGSLFEQATALELLTDQMVPLYTHYIDDHILRLELLARNDLADAFRDWRNNLIS